MYARVNVPSKIYIPNDLLSFFSSNCEALLTIFLQQFHKHDLLDATQLNKTFTKILKMEGKLVDEGGRGEIRSTKGMTQEEKDAVVRGYMLRSAEKELITKVESMCYEFLKRVVMEFEEIRMKYCGRAAG